MTGFKEVIPYGNANAQNHIARPSGEKTLCGVSCEGWTLSGDVSQRMLDSVYCCTRCRAAYFKRKPNDT